MKRPMPTDAQIEIAIGWLVTAEGVADMGDEHKMGCLEVAHFLEDILAEKMLYGENFKL